MIFSNLYPIALSIMIIPATQVSVERLFFVFKWVYKERRSKLKESNIENILHLNLNYHL